LKDFIPVASLTNQPYVLVAGKPAGIITVRELIAAAKVKPGELKFGSAGAGAGTHFGIVKFNLEAGIKAVDVPPQPSWLSRFHKAPKLAPAHGPLLVESVALGKFVQSRISKLSSR
jgi:hypothetical protein